MISIFIDTNILYSNESNNFKDIYFFETITSLLEEIEARDWYENVQIVIPNIVLRELFMQFKDKYYSKLSSVSSCIFPHINIDSEFDHIAYIDNLYNTGLANITDRTSKCIILQNPSNECLNDIITRAINKEDPFEGKTKESDKGFKDVVIWESILEYKRLHRLDDIVLYCNDNKLSSSILEKEFKEKFSDKIIIIKKEKNLPHSNLYETVSNLLCDDSVPSFGFILKKRILSTLTSANLNCYFEGLEFDVEYECEDSSHTFTEVCDGIRITYKNIDKIDDSINTNAILFDITIDGVLYYEVGDEDFTNTLEQDFNEYCQLTIEYKFDDDKLYIVKANIFGDNIDVDDTEALIEM